MILREELKFVIKDSGAQSVPLDLIQLMLMWFVRKLEWDHQVRDRIRYILMYLCCVESLSRFQLQFFKLWPIFKIGQNLKKSLYYSTVIFSKNGSKITKIFYYIFLYILMY